MKLKKCLSLTLALVLLCGVLAGCGASANTNASMKSMAYDAAPAAEAVEEFAAAETMAGGALRNDAGESGSAALPEGRKWIITIDMYVETDDLDALMPALDEKIAQLDGYVEAQSLHNGSTYASRRYRNANLTVRIPDEKVEQFTSEMQGIANVVSENLNREDITLQYVATSSRVTALETEEARLLELLAQAETMEDLLTIEARLTDVRYELENYASQLRLYDNQVDYATIFLNIEEVQEYTPVEEPTFLERIKNTFSDSLEGLGDGIVNVTVFLIGNSPYLLVLGVIAAAIILLLRRTAKIRAARKAKKNENT